MIILKQETICLVHIIEVYAKVTYVSVNLWLLISLAKWGRTEHHQLYAKSGAKNYWLLWVHISGTIEQLAEKITQKDEFSLIEEVKLVNCDEMLQVLMSLAKGRLEA